MIYFCCDDLRRTVVSQAAGWNGIDFLEVVDHAAANDADRQRFLTVHFVKNLGALVLQPNNIRIEGGERIQNIKVLSTSAGSGSNANALTVEVDRPGDFSIYRFRLVKDVLDDAVPDTVDPELAAIVFSFKVECPSPFDCAPQHICPPEPASIPDIDYLAKDYVSFRRLMLDRIAALMPEWRERNAADIGIMLVEALAYTADLLSYQQDAIATEAYLGTARQRISVRRHARLMDYFMSEGANARTWVHFHVSADAFSPNPNQPLIPKGTKLFTRIPGQQTLIADDPRVYDQADAAFQTMEDVDNLYADHNELYFYTWSGMRCCLPQDATSATLAGHHPNLAPGSILIFEESLGAKTGSPADSDPTRRHVVRLASAKFQSAPATDLADPVTGNAITEISWDAEDALPFALCISAQTEDGYKERVSVARGNNVLADHGLTRLNESIGQVPEPYVFNIPSQNQDRCLPIERKPVFPRFRPRLKGTPLTHSAPAYERTNAASSATQWSERDVKPAIALTSTLGSATAQWVARRDLLSSDASAEEFVAETENDGGVRLRFGDDVHGKRPEPGTTFTATYRVGNGKAGNIGSDSLAHIAANIPQIVSLRNPLSATGGQDPESIEDVRQRAPIAYRMQERAVTPADYAEVTERHSGVQRAAATFRWTGSWHTVFLTVDRSAGLRVDKTFEQDIRAHVERYRMAGHDVEIDSPQFVALEIALFVCVSPDHFRSDVERELLDVFSNRDLRDGRRGLFHPDNFTFGQHVYLSAIYAAAHQVTGVESVEVRTFQRLGLPSNAALECGRLDIDRLEIARLDNDRNFAEHGVLSISLGGGK